MRKSPVGVHQGLHIMFAVLFWIGFCVAIAGTLMTPSEALLGNVVWAVGFLLIVLGTWQSMVRHRDHHEHERHGLLRMVFRLVVFFLLLLAQISVNLV